MTALANAAGKAREWTARRDDLIREQRWFGVSLRAIAREAGLSHTAVKKIVERGNGQ